MQGGAHLQARGGRVLPLPAGQPQLARQGPGHGGLPHTAREHRAAGALQHAEHHSGGAGRGAAEPALVRAALRPPLPRGPLPRAPAGRAGHAPRDMGVIHGGQVHLPGPLAGAAHGPVPGPQLQPAPLQGGQRHPRRGLLLRRPDIGGPPPPRVPRAREPPGPDGHAVDHEGPAPGKRLRGHQRRAPGPARVQGPGAARRDARGLPGRLLRGGHHAARGVRTGRPRGHPGHQPPRALRGVWRRAGLRVGQGVPRGRALPVHGPLRPLFRAHWGGGLQVQPGDGAAPRAPRVAAQEAGEGEGAHAALCQGLALEAAGQPRGGERPAGGGLHAPHDAGGAQAREGLRPALRLPQPAALRSDAVRLDRRVGPAVPRQEQDVALPDGLELGEGLARGAAQKLPRHLAPLT
mmetsp:Transcript_14934/g.50339  ORF Transcript_14934/g.50339 Transcript_14934/m.50339 type:complete len:406 (+) Transcript_14934:322-1539(+)